MLNRKSFEFTRRGKNEDFCREILICVKTTEAKLKLHKQLKN